VRKHAPLHFGPYQRASQASALHDFDFGHLGRRQSRNIGGNNIREREKPEKNGDQKNKEEFEENMKTAKYENEASGATTPRKKIQERGTIKNTK